MYLLHYIREAVAVRRMSQDDKEVRDLIICGGNISLWLKPMLSRLTVIIDRLYLQK